MTPHPDRDSRSHGQVDSRGGLFGDLFGTDAMRAVFGDIGLVQSWLDTEAALALAEAELGIIPKSAAAIIERHAVAERLDLAAIRAGIREADHPLISTIWAFAGSCPDGAGEYVHWGATTQDIMDTGLVLQLRSALHIIQGRLGELIALVRDLTIRERATLMAGRTHGQQALPITLGFKTAVWLAELLRHRDRLAQVRSRILVGQLSGASGSLASFEGRGLAVQEEFCRRLGIGVAPIAWHVARDALAELANDFAMIAATCSRIAMEVIQLQRTEIGELEEHQHAANVGSSTMPQKRNPMTAEGVVAAARLVRRNVPTALEGMLAQHERDMSVWQSEWAYVPEVCTLTDATLELTLEVIADLYVDRDRMAQNLGMSGGLIVAEAVMIELAKHYGRQRAHTIVHEVAMRSVENRVPFLDALMAQPDITEALGAGDEIAQLLDPAGYLGEISSMIDRVLRLERGEAP